MVQFDRTALQNYVSNLSDSQRSDLKQFIRNNISLIDTHDFDALYDKSGYKYGYNFSQAELTAILLLSDIDPLRYINELPSGCFKSLPITSIVIPHGVTKIGNAAFSSCRKLTSVTIPDSVKDVEDSAFFSCTGLTEITIPERITNIGYFAFDHCESLKNITIPKSVSEFKDYTFDGCKNLTSINYTGTKQDWLNAVKRRYWRTGSSIEKIICSDGEVKLRTR